MAKLNTKTSIVDALKAQGQDSSFSARKELAAQNGIKNYTGTAAQNQKLLSIVNSSSSSSKSTSTTKKTTTTTKTENNTTPAFSFKEYEQSQAVKDALAQLQNHYAGGAPTWSGGSYGTLLSDIMNKINNRDPFSYDLNGDALYQQYKNKYINQGKLAMMDTVGQVSALTGGYGNSYAETAGNQAYQGYLQNLNDIVPDLYNLALNTYETEGNKLYNQYNMYNDAYNREYSQYQDSLSAWNAEGERLNQAYQYAQNLDYGMYQDAYNNAFNQYQQSVSESQFNQNLDFQKQQFAENLALQKAQFDLQKQKAASSGSGSSSSAKKTTSNTTNKTATPSADYSNWRSGDWTQYFSYIRSNEGTAAAQSELNSMISKGLIPQEYIALATITAKGSTGR